MPEYVRLALASKDLMAAYQERLAYQLTDYLSWIDRA
jgi:hypothetical protein